MGTTMQVQFPSQQQRRHPSCLLLVITLFYFLCSSTLPSLITPVLAQVECGSFNSCGPCANNTQCGWCVSQGSCYNGNADGPYSPNSCTAPPVNNWLFSPGNCPEDMCTGYSSSCALCAGANPQLSCGWCEDWSITGAQNYQCVGGTTSGPNVGNCSAAGWSLQSCSSAAACGSHSDCSSCLEEAAVCGFCASSQTCSLGGTGGPGYAGVDMTCPGPSWNWMFDSDYSFSNLQCYQPQPFNQILNGPSTIDYVSYSLVGFIWLVIIICFILFSGCCECRSIVPQPGEEMEKQLLDEYGDGDDDAYERLEQQASGCWKNMNRGEWKLMLWLLSLVQLVLAVSALGLDIWSQSIEDSPNLIGYDNPLTTIEGVLGTRLTEGSDNHNPNSYTYDCAVLSGAAYDQCQVHNLAGYHTLGCGLIAAVTTLAVVLAATSDLCCAPRYSGGPSLAPNPYAQVKVKYPFSVYQWRFAALSAVFAYSSTAFWLCGSYLLSQHYFDSTFKLNVSFYLMAGCALHSSMLALLYRRAIRCIPREGYSIHNHGNNQQSGFNGMGSGIGIPQGSRGENPYYYSNGGGNGAPDRMNNNGRNNNNNSSSRYRQSSSRSPLNAGGVAGVGNNNHNNAALGGPMGFPGGQKSPYSYQSFQSAASSLQNNNHFNEQQNNNAAVGSNINGPNSSAGHSRHNSNTGLSAVHFPPPALNYQEVHAQSIPSRGNNGAPPSPGGQSAVRLSPGGPPSPHLTAMTNSLQNNLISPYQNQQQLQQQQQQGAVAGVGMNLNQSPFPVSQYVQVPFSQYVGVSDAGGGAYMPPPGYVLVPAAQAAQYFSNTTTSSAASSPRMSPHHSPSMMPHPQPMMGVLQPTPMSLSGASQQQQQQQSVMNAHAAAANSGPEGMVLSSNASAQLLSLSSRATVANIVSRSHPQSPVMLVSPAAQLQQEPDNDEIEGEPGDE